MTDKKDDADQGEEFRNKLQEMLHNANVAFSFGSPPPVPNQAGGDEAPKDDQSSKTRAEALRRIRDFNLKPREIRDHLDRFVIRQADAKKVLAVAICDHYNHVRLCIEDPAHAEKEYAKHNIVLLGPSGVGKTYLMRCIAKLIGVPYVKADATKFSETGYVGHDVEDLVRDLVRTADGDTDLAQYGIIYVDEIDKIASAPTVGKDVSGRGVQTNLLKLMEDTEVSLHSQTDLIGQVQAVMDLQRGKERKRTINTRHMLFIVSGAFDQLTDQVKNRVESSQIGFQQPSDSEHDDTQYLKLAETRDFIKYGFEPEFIGRLPIRVVCDRLAAGDLEEIVLNSEESILRQYQADFTGYGIELAVTGEAISRIAELAATENTGARGLMTVFEKILRNFKFELPSTSLTSLEISTAAVDDPDTALRDLLKSGDAGQNDVLRNDIESFAKRFENQHGFKLTFTKAAIAALLDISVARDMTIRALCEEKFRDFQHGLTLASRNSGKTTFTISRKVIDAPGRELSRIVAKSFEKK